MSVASKARILAFTAVSGLSCTPSGALEPAPKTAEAAPAPKPDPAPEMPFGRRMAVHCAETPESLKDAEIYITDAADFRIVAEDIVVNVQGLRGLTQDAETKGQICVFAAIDIAKGPEPDVVEVSRAENALLTGHCKMDLPEGYIAKQFLTVFTPTDEQTQKAGLPPGLKAMVDASGRDALPLSPGEECSVTSSLMSGKPFRQALRR